MISTQSLSGSEWELYAEDSLSVLPRGERIPAAVPGNVQAALESARRLRPLWHGTGDERLMEVGLSGWWYETAFEVQTLTASLYSLVFEGVDFACDIYVNNHLCGYNAGSFKRFTIDITPYVRQGENMLKVYLHPMPKEFVPWITGSDGKQSGVGTPFFFVEANNQLRRMIKGLKFPANMSYDWGTNVYTLGIWKDLFLKTTGDLRIDWLSVKPSLNRDFSKACVRVTAEAVAARETDATLRVCLAGHGTRLCTDVSILFQKGINQAEAVIELDHPSLWWPVGYGEQALYEISVEIIDASGTVSDRASTRTGIRDVQWRNVEGAPENFENPFGLILNGMPIRTMGSNLTATDLLFGRAPERGHHYVASAKACGMNTLRLHGAQGVFQTSVFEAADEMGILLLVDFPMGNCVPENDDAFLQVLDDTIRNVVKQLVNHPSIIEWSGGNEMEWCFRPGQHIAALETIRSAARMEDETRLFRDTCPVNGSRHSPWDYNPDITYRQFNADIMDNMGNAPMMRYGEFGCQTPANLEVWFRDIPIASRWPIDPNDAVLIRKNVVEAVFGRDFWLCLPLIERMFGEMDGIEKTIRAGQLLGAEGLRYQMDALRAKGKRIGGFTSWDFNEPWPNGAGSFVIDYDGRPVMAYYFAKQALSPVTLQLRYDHILYPLFRDTYAQLLLVSDLPKDAEGLAYKWVARAGNGEVFGTGSGNADISPQEALTLCTIPVSPPESHMRGPVLIELELRDSDGQIMAERLHVFGAAGVSAPLAGLLDPNLSMHAYGMPYVTTSLSSGGVKRTSLALGNIRAYEKNGAEHIAIDLKNTGDMTALFVELHPLTNYRTDLFIDNNFISIPPGETRELLVHANMGGCKLEDTGFRVSCFNADNIVIPPSKAVIVYMGRCDGTCCQYAGYLTADTAHLAAQVRAENREVPAVAVPYALRGRVEFAFTAEQKAATKLEFSVCDVSADGANVQITLGAHTSNITLLSGLGGQLEHPDSACYAQTYTLELPETAMVKGENLLVFETRSGWFTWDALRLVAR